ncbi:GNAT family N-acetyltransferase [Aurantimonas sp. 22II-16-19i]|uniref:GNAT family N-acetyltransferase n=1 Tax=Aurantimonas sp. 22II-16-19i TaxID=1317114 RepID=UPI0009F7F0C9|nr:GNAT family N-acetyltransferase [Aurantimonas sp. 22II-16-19i]ORE98192.1 acetyltransferase [Aurantimonas sp. 22II-16-19i]
MTAAASGRSGTIEIRPMTPAEVELAIEWATLEGWNPGLADAVPFRVADPGGFLMAFLDGEPAASISVVASGERHGFLGFYIVRPQLRGRGIGWALWQAGIARLGSRSIGLDGVVDQQANYAKSGFVLKHRNIRYMGPVPEPTAAPETVRAVSAEDLPALAVFDAAHFGSERTAFLEAWLSTPGHVARIADGSDDDGEGGGIRGYGVVRPARTGFKIGPLFARSPEVASDLFDALVRTVPPGESIILDVPEPNGAAIALAERHGLKPVFETARMVKGEAPSLPLAEIFGVTSFELG